jgi:DNA-binding CsgD family transcriptional regulator
MTPDAVSARSGGELKSRMEAERAGEPFLVYRDAAGSQVIRSLPAEPARLAIGRGDRVDIVLDFDSQVSRLHAELERIGDDWVLGDEGFSRNGSFVNGERLRQRHRLTDRDVLRFGGTTVVYRAPLQQIAATIPEHPEEQEIRISPAQRRVLVALCRPFRDHGEFATPASNQEIADELVLSVEAVKTHLRALFERFGVGDLPRQSKRAELVKRAFQSGTISPRDLDE